jgi:hypothetical protein
MRSGCRRPPLHLFVVCLLGQLGCASRFPRSGRRPALLVAGASRPPACPERARGSPPITGESDRPFKPMPPRDEHLNATVNEACRNPSLVWFVLGLPGGFDDGFCGSRWCKAVKASRRRASFQRSGNPSGTAPVRATSGRAQSGWRGRPDQTSANRADELPALGRVMPVCGGSFAWLHTGQHCTQRARLSPIRCTSSDGVPQREHCAITGRKRTHRLAASLDSDVLPFESGAPIITGFLVARGSRR